LGLLSGYFNRHLSLAVRTDILNPAPTSALDFESSEMIGVVEGDHRGKH
jgi:hypothetical protein